MSANGSNRALRALVAELAELDDRDLEAILADLEPGERDQLVELMAEYRGGGQRSAEAPGSALELSAWLSDRLTGPADPGMTDAAAEALRQAAAERGWRGVSLGRTAAARPGRRAWSVGQP